MHFIKTGFFILLVCCCSILKAQVPVWQSTSKEEVAKAFEQMNNRYIQTPVYAVNITHASYEDYQTKVPFEKMSGYFNKDKNNYHSFLLGIHTIQNARYKVVVDSLNRKVMVANPGEVIKDAVSMKDFEEPLSRCTSLKKIESGKEKRYRLEFENDDQVKAYEIALYPEGMVKEIVIYYNREVKKDEEDVNGVKKKPRVVIFFSNYRTHTTFNYNDEFSESNYLTVSKENKLLLNIRYKEYKLSDQRLIVN